MRELFFGETISRCGVAPDHHELHMLTDIPPPNSKKEVQSFRYNELPGKFLPSSAEICKPS